MSYAPYRKNGLNVSFEEGNDIVAADFNHKTRDLLARREKKNWIVKFSGNFDDILTYNGSSHSVVLQGTTTFCIDGAYIFERTSSTSQIVPTTGGPFYVYLFYNYNDAEIGIEVVATQKTGSDLDYCIYLGTVTNLGVITLETDLCVPGFCPNVAITDESLLESAAFKATLRPGDIVLLV